MRVQPLLVALGVSALLETLPPATALANEDPADVERMEPTRVATSFDAGPTATFALEVPWALRTTSTVAFGSPKLTGSWALIDAAGSRPGVALRSEIELHTDSQTVSLGGSTAATSVDLSGAIGPLALFSAIGPRLGAELEWTYEAALAVELAPWMSLGARMNGVSQRRLDAHEAFGGAALDLELTDDVVVSTFAGRGVRSERYVLPNWMVWTGATLPL